MRDAPSWRVPCPHVLRLPILGVETTFATNAPEVVEVVGQVYGHWEGLRGSPDAISPSGAEVRIVVDPPRREGGDRSVARPGFGSRTAEAGEAPAIGAAGQEGGEGGRRRGAVLRALDRTTLRIEGPGASGTAHARRLESRARVPADLVARREEFVEDWLEPLTLFLLGACDRQPVHASAVAFPGAPQFLRIEPQVAERTARGTAPEGGVGGGDVPEAQAAGGDGVAALLLAGPSGAGKSTLTYAAWRSGRFGVLADEPVYVQLRPRTRVWGRRPRLHLPLDARARFPELRNVAATPLSTGKTKLVVDASAGSPSYAESTGLCLLARSSGARPRLESVTTERAVAELTGELDPGYDLFADTIGERIVRVAGGGVWRLYLTDDPRAALPLLTEAVHAVRERG